MASDPRYTLDCEEPIRSAPATDLSTGRRSPQPGAAHPHYDAPFESILFQPRLDVFTPELWVASGRVGMKNQDVPLSRRRCATPVMAKRHAALGHQAASRSDTVGALRARVVRQSRAPRFCSWPTTTIGASPR